MQDYYTVLTMSVNKTKADGITLHYSEQPQTMIFFNYASTKYREARAAEHSITWAEPPGRTYRPV